MPLIIKSIITSVICKDAHTISKHLAKITQYLTEQYLPDEIFPKTNVSGFGKYVDAASETCFEMTRNMRIYREPPCEFDFKRNPRIEKNSQVYHILKYGPIPKCDFRYLIRDGNRTEFARWLMYAADMDLRFVDLCLLVKIVHMYVIFRDHNMPRNILREWLYGQFCIDHDFSTIRNALTRLKKRKLIFTAPLRSVSCTDQTAQYVLDLLGDDFNLLFDYIDKVMYGDLYCGVG